MTEHQLRQSYQQQLEAQGIHPTQAAQVAEALITSMPSSWQLFLLHRTWKQFLDQEAKR